jgi:uncharacterized membrane protein
MKKIFLYLMALLYVAAGINHFANAGTYENIMPPYLPWHLVLIYASGIGEIVCGVLLVPLATRRFGAWMTIALLIAVFPANIQMMINYMHAVNPQLWVAVLRLPLQGVLIWWAFQYTKSANYR